MLFAECRKHNIETIPLKRLTKDVLRCIRYGIASLQQDMMVTCVDRMSDGLAKRPDEEKEQLKKIILGKCYLLINFGFIVEDIKVYF